MSVAHKMSRTHIVYLYSSVKLFNCQGMVKYESLGQITSCWVGQDKQGRYNIEESWQRAQSTPRMRMDVDGRIREMLQEIAAQVCIKMYTL
jgi:hypothetical protein